METERPIYINVKTSDKGDDKEVRKMLEWLVENSDETTSNT
jgi:hypothetical protein